MEGQRMHAVIEKNGTDSKTAEIVIMYITYYHLSKLFFQLSVGSCSWIDRRRYNYGSSGRLQQTES